MTTRREFFTYSALVGFGSLLPATLPAAVDAVCEP